MLGASVECGVSKEMSVQGYWADLPSSAFADLPADMVAVLPLGATEQHGPHLPLSVDSHLIDGVAGRMLTALSHDQSVLVLPTLTITKSDEHLDYPGTLILSAETLLAVLRETGASVARAGVERLVLFNGHGGNTALLQIAARDLRRTHDMVVAVCSWGAFAEWERDFEPKSYAQDIHAGESETSAMLALRPGLVDMDKAQDFAPPMDDWAKSVPGMGLAGSAVSPGWVAQDLHPSGACGNAAAATPDKGEVLLESAGRNFARFLADFARFDHRGQKP